MSYTPTMPVDVTRRLLHEVNFKAIRRARASLKNNEETSNLNNNYSFSFNFEVLLKGNDFSIIESLQREKPSPFSETVKKFAPQGSSTNLTD